MSQRVQELEISAEFVSVDVFVMSPLVIDSAEVEDRPAESAKVGSRLPYVLFVAKLA